MNVGQFPNPKFGIYAFNEPKNSAIQSSELLELPFTWIGLITHGIIETLVDVDTNFHQKVETGFLYT